MNETIYDIIGVNYYSARQADPYITKQITKYLQPQKGKIYLDIGCGTGNYTISLANAGFIFYGVDPSKEMLTKARSVNNNITWLLGTAENIPAPNNSFDGAIATLTIHHWANLAEAFNELSRVLKANGKLVIFTSTPDQMKEYWLNHYFPQMMAHSINQMPALETISEALGNNGFAISRIAAYFIQDNLKDCFLYVGKNKPELYFSETIRNGISSFAALANPLEIQRGLARLASNISDGTFSKIKSQYRNDRGDYIFITAEKGANENELTKQKFPTHWFGSHEP
jgi:ubiquinone/menaquinone biosynthesis C-methylase UbiE